MFYQLLIRIWYTQKEWRQEKKAKFPSCKICSSHLMLHYNYFFVGINFLLFGKHVFWFFSLVIANQKMQVFLPFNGAGPMVWKSENFPSPKNVNHFFNTMCPVLHMHGLWAVIKCIQNPNLSKLLSTKKFLQFISLHIHLEIFIFTITPLFFYWKPKSLVMSLMEPLSWQFQFLN